MIWATLLIWLAKQLISYFLKTNLDLSRQLEESVKRNEEHQRELDNLEDELDVLLQDKADAIDDIEHANAEILKLDAEWDRIFKKKEEAQERYEKILNELSDDDVLRADLPESSHRGFIGNLK